MLRFFLVTFLLFFLVHVKSQILKKNELVYELFFASSNAFWGDYDDLFTTTYLNQTPEITTSNVNSSTTIGFRSSYLISEKWLLSASMFGSNQTCELY